MSTGRSMTAKTPIVPRTVLDLALGIYVEESALFLVTSVKSRVEIALRHSRHIVLVKKFATVAFFAERSKPMLAHDCLLLGFDMSEGTELLIAKI